MSPPDVADACPQIEIDEALRHGWFEIWYHPKIDLKRKRLAGAEARPWLRHPRFGVIAPENMPALTDDAVSRLSEHTLIATLASWSKFDEAGFNLSLAVNVALDVLLNSPIAALVEEHRPKSDRWPGMILEVTEDQIVRAIPRAQDVACRLRTQGVNLSIDHFGAGYSSLASLRELPFVEIKLDESFVQGCASDHTNAAICQTAIDLSHRFGSAAVAQGIESSADLQALMAMSCDFGQGPLVSRPMPQKEFLALLLQRVSRDSPPAPDEAPADAAPANASPVDRVA